MCVYVYVIEEMEIKEKVCAEGGRARKKTIKLFICRSQSEIRKFYLYCVVVWKEKFFMRH